MATISWIEDNHDRLSSLIKPLQDKHEVFIYGSLNEVNADIETIASSDVIILDIILPTTGTLPAIDGDMLYSGFAIFKKLLLEYSYNGIVVVLSSVINPLVYDRFRNLGVPEEYILHKPIRPSELYKVITQALEKKS